MPRIRITVDGRTALTVEQAAERYRVSNSSMRVTLFRLGLEPVAKLDGRKHLYLSAELAAAMQARPGKGRPGVPRGRAPNERMTDGDPR